MFIQKVNAPIYGLVSQEDKMSTKLSGLLFVALVCVVGLLFVVSSIGGIVSAVLSDPGVQKGRAVLDKMGAAPSGIETVKYVPESGVSGEILYCHGIPMELCNAPQNVTVIDVDGTATVEPHVDWVSAWVDYAELIHQSHTSGAICVAHHGYLSMASTWCAVRVRDMQDAARKAHEFIDLNTKPSTTEASVVSGVVVRPVRDRVSASTCCACVSRQAK